MVPFEEVVSRHGAAVLRVCQAVVGPDDADDAWSETFLSALKAYPSLPEDANVQAWLVTIAHRKAVDRLRSRARTEVPVDPVPSDVSDVGVPGAGHRHDSLYDALAALPVRQRHAVAYHHLAGLPHADVAVILQTSPAAARRASADGVAALRRRLNPSEVLQ